MEKDDFLKKLEKLVAHAKSKHNTVDAGEINAVGTHEELLRDNAIYREIYQAQQRGGDFDAQT